MNDFNDLEVWKKAKEVTILIYGSTKRFPREELYGLSDQLKRASNSICANIAEGFCRYHTKDKIKFYYNARGSASECKSHLYIAKDLDYIDANTLDDYIIRFNSIGRMINSLINSLNQKIVGF